MGDVTWQIGGKVVKSPWGLKVTWNKSLFTGDGETTIRYYMNATERQKVIDRLKGNKRVKKVEKLGNK